MSRGRRRISGTNVYHIVSRGNNQENIFLDEKDKIHFLGLMKNDSDKLGVKIYAYCIMTNHTHILLKSALKTTSLFMQEVNSKYACYYNCKYDKSGHAFQGRFYSSPVETESYLFSCVRYIHNNPVKASIANKIEEYRFSSVREHCLIWNPQGKIKKGIIDKEIMNVLKKRFQNLNTFLEFHELFDNQDFIDIKTEKEEYDFLRIKYEAERFIQSHDIRSMKLLLNIPHLRTEFLETGKKNTGVSKNKILTFLKILAKSA